MTAQQQLHALRKAVLRQHGTPTWLCCSGLTMVSPWWVQLEHRHLLHACGGITGAGSATVGKAVWML